MPGGNVPSRPIKTSTSTKSVGRGNPNIAAKSNDSNKVQMMQRAQVMRKENAKKLITTNKQKAKTGKVVIPQIPPPPPPGPPVYDDNIPYTPPPVMVPERDVVNLAVEQLDSKTIENLLFENIGANELTKFVRHDTVQGNNPLYNIISNLSDIRRKFDPVDLISVQVPDSPFQGNSIDLNKKIPTEEYLQALGLTDYVYIDSNGDLIIEVVNMRDKEIVEVQIDSNGTIYEVN
jgi:hypothetical protein